MVYIELISKTQVRTYLSKCLSFQGQQKPKRSTLFFFHSFGSSFCSEPHSFWQLSQVIPSRFGNTSCIASPPTRTFEYRSQRYLSCLVKLCRSSKF
jgi:hypothetical protein